MKTKFCLMRHPYTVVMSLTIALSKLFHHNKQDLPIWSHSSLVVSHEVIIVYFKLFNIYRLNIKQPLQK